MPNTAQDNLRGGLEGGELARTIDYPAKEGGTSDIGAASGSVHLPPPAQATANTGLANRPVEGVGRLAGGKTPDAIRRYLQGVTFPANKEDVVRAAHRNGAPDDVLAAVTSLPSAHYPPPTR
ncbi:MAG: DUF2795 domain-containing protein [Gemmataceae bacterium]